MYRLSVLIITCASYEENINVLVLLSGIQVNEKQPSKASKPEVQKEELI